MDNINIKFIIKNLKIIDKLFSVDLENLLFFCLEFLKENIRYVKTFIK